MGFEAENGLETARQTKIGRKTGKIGKSTTDGHGSTRMGKNRGNFNARGARGAKDAKGTQAGGGTKRFRFRCSRPRWGRNCFLIAGLNEASYRKAECGFSTDPDAPRDGTDGHGWRGEEQPALTETRREADNRGLKDQFMKQTPSPLIPSKNMKSSIHYYCV